MSYKVNRLLQDDFGRTSGVIAIDKPVDMTSHEVVDIARQAFKTKQVGHAGALDPFASGVLILLVGKATKYSDLFLNADKEYVADVLFGLQTNSADTEGEIIAQVTDLGLLNEADLKATLQSFTPEYKQYVPVFSSVKVDGDKLRVLARASDKFEIVSSDEARIVKFYKGDKVKEINLPAHVSKIPEIELLKQELVDISTSAFYKDRPQQIHSTTFPVATTRVVCSKGTYIRSLAEDIGLALPHALPAMLYGLQRTRVGDILLSESLQLTQLENLGNA